MLHAIPAWSGFLSIHLISQINGLLKRCYKYGYCLKINTVEEVIESANYKLFRSLQNPQHRIHSILPPTKPLNHDSDPKGTIARSPTTLQSCINDLSFSILCSSITDFSCTLCSEKKHPLTFSFISPWVICRFKQELQWTYLRNVRFWKCRNSIFIAADDVIMTSHL